MENSRNLRTKFAALSLSVGSFAASAAPDLTAEIAAAATTATDNNTAVIAGVIALAILGFGVASLLGLFRKS